MLKPVGENVLVKPFPPSEKTLSGLYIPDSAKKVSNRVRIVAVGEGSEKKPMKLKANDIGYRVLDWGEPIEIGGELYFLMNQSAILALE